MRQLSGTFGGVTLSTLKRLRQFLPKLRTIPQETREFARANREAFEKLLPQDFSWARLYELTAPQLSLLTLSSIGLIDRLIESSRAGVNLNEFLIQQVMGQPLEDELIDNWAGGHQGLFNKVDTIAIHCANTATIRCLMVYGHYLNDLVSMACKGDSEAFFKAISIDRTVLTLPSFAAHLARAEFYGDKRFMIHLRKAVKGKPHENFLVHQDLRVMLQCMSEARMLGELTMSEADQLFIRELKVYSDGEGDSARSLMRFIQRWKQAKEDAAT
ncbi:MAG: hypothetical protein AB1513_10605 [Pseudomonadota bacterium]